MVLINELTVEQINAALLHLQRSKDEVVGGNKGTTIQNISISNSGGGGNNVDYSGTIKNLATNIEKNKTAIEKNASDIAKLKSDFSNIEKSVEDTLEGLVDNGISDLSFDPLTKQLTITTNDGDTYQTVIEQDIGYLSYDSATNKLILTTGNQTQEITLPYIKASEKGSANGVATLDENGRVPYSQLPESAMEFLGQWDASTNTPHLADGTGTNGDFYIVSAGGTVNLGTAQDPHIITFSVNDRIVYEGDIAQWVRLPAGQVSSVNGQSGEVTLTASDIEYSTGVSIKDKIDANAVQADWNVTDTTSLAYIKNKPSVSVLGNTSGCALGTASAGSCTTAARSDHVHPLPTLVTCSCYSNQLHGCLANYSCGLQLAVSQSSIDMYQKQGDTSKNVNINVNGGICQVSLYNGTSNALGTLRVGELNSLRYVTARTGFRSGTGNGYFYTSDGNTLNYSSDYAYMWLNYRGGTSVVHIGSGNADGCHGTVYAACFCGDLDGIVSRCGSVNGGYYVTVPSPANTTHYVLVNVGSVYGGNVVAQIYTSKYHISKSDSSSRVVTDGVNYGSFAYSHLGTEASPSSCIWLCFTGWRPMLLCGEFPITIVCNTTTAPSGVTFNSPVYNYANKLLLASRVSCTGTATDDVGLLYASYNNSNMPGTYGNVIQMQTDTGALTRWGYQLAFPTNGCLQYRRWTNTTSIGGWNSFITSENISSQHVACADHATSADNVTSLDWTTISTFTGVGNIQKLGNTHLYKTYLTGCCVKQCDLYTLLDDFVHCAYDRCQYEDYEIGGIGSFCCYANNMNYICNVTKVYYYRGPSSNYISLYNGNTCLFSVSSNVTSYKVLNSFQFITTGVI